VREAAGGLPMRLMGRPCSPMSYRGYECELDVLETATGGTLAARSYDAWFGPAENDGAAISTKVPFQHRVGGFHGLRVIIIRTVFEAAL
jgi:hypothetical protein